MSIKKMLFVVLVASGVMLAVGGSATYARFSESVAAWPAEPGWMSGEVTVSTLDNDQYSPAMAYNWKHNEYLVIWENVWGGGGHDIYAQRVTSSGELESWFYVPDDSTFTKENRMQPDVAYDPVNDRYLVTWIYWDGIDWNVHGRFIPWDGPSASLTEFQICNWGSDQAKPKVAYARNPQEFFVVWVNTTAPAYYISGHTVPADGSYVDPAGGVTISSGTQDRDFPDVTYNLARNDYLVTWDVNNGGATGIDIYGERIRASDLHQYGEFGIAGWAEDEEHPAVAACNDTDQYLVAWQSLQSGTPNHNDVYVRFVDGDGSFPAGGGPHVIYDTPIHEQNPDVACNSTTSGSMFLVTYEEQYSNITGPYGIWGRFVYQDYSMSSVFGIIDGTGSLDRTQPVVAGGGANYMVAWEHDRSGTSYQDIHGRILSPYAIFLPLVMRNH
ncbi:MAG: hypothetical protein DRI81_11655 [Chloroflexi bacterium]|nr:MAG: hypothetical protein DRI81_11655 [Chloroflexota bacterium]